VAVEQAASELTVSAKARTGLLERIIAVVLRAEDSCISVNEYGFVGAEEELAAKERAAFNENCAAGVCRVVESALNSCCVERFGIEANPALIYMTCGAAASLCCVLTALCGKGEEAAVIAPFFPEYRVFIERTGAKVQVIPAREGDFQIDECALREGIHPNTALLIINSPNNPTGAVLTEESLCTLARVLREKAAEYGHPIYLVSDEPYRELSYDKPVPYVTKFYRDTLVCYSFSKSLSLPGERIGYVAVNPDMPDAQDVFKAVCGAGRALGYVCAPALMQYMAGELIGQTADVNAYRENRDLLYGALRDMGFTCVYPDGAFYLFMKAAQDDAYAFCEKARQFELLLVPGDDFGGAGYVRISYCVSRDTILRSLPAFEKLSSLYGLKKEI